MRLTGKGRISTGLDADFSILDSNGGVSHVMANGRWMVQDGTPVVKGTFE
jgi:beta-aspartyl-dipeptidase (metallo-type)